MFQTRLAGRAIKRPRGGRMAVNIPLRAAMGAAERMKAFHSIPLAGAPPAARDAARSDGASGRVEAGESCTVKGSSGALETLIWGAQQAGQNAVRSSMERPQR